MFRRNVLPLEASTNIRKRVTKKRNEKRTQRWSILLDEFRSRVSEIRQMMMAASAVDTVAKLLVAMLLVASIIDVKLSLPNILYVKLTLQPAASNSFF
jgi:hypothetical protein